MKKIICFFVLALFVVSCGGKSESSNAGSSSESSASSSAVDVELEDIAGTFETDSGDIELILKGPSQMYISGFMMSDMGNIGELDNLVIGYQSDVDALVYEDHDYKLTVKIIDANTIEIEEENATHGSGVSFSGVWSR